jgi:hypothetical protein
MLSHGTNMSSEEFSCLINVFCAFDHAEVPTPVTQEQMQCLQRRSESNQFFVYSCLIL